MISGDRTVPPGVAQPAEAQNACSDTRVGIGVERLVQVRKCVRVIIKVNLKAAHVDHAHAA